MTFAWLRTKPRHSEPRQVLVMILVEYIEDLCEHVILKGISVLGV